MSTIVGVGTDLVELERLAEAYRRHGERLLARICRPGELKQRSGSALIQHLGGLFAAKEAVLKALGTGWSQGLGFRQVEVVEQTGGAPAVRLHDQAAARAAELGIARLHVSITHERRYAAAVAVAEGGIPGGSPHE